VTAGLTGSEFNPATTRGEGRTLKFTVVGNAARRIQHVSDGALMPRVCFECYVSALASCGGLPLSVR
jgi:hypothetical protein